MPNGVTGTGNFSEYRPGASNHAGGYGETADSTGYTSEFTDKWATMMSRMAMEASSDLPARSGAPDFPSE